MNKSSREFWIQSRKEPYAWHKNERLALKETLQIGACVLHLVTEVPQIQVLDPAFAVIDSTRVEKSIFPPVFAACKMLLVEFDGVPPDSISAASTDTYPH